MVGQMKKGEAKRDAADDRAIPHVATFARRNSPAYARAFENDLEIPRDNTYADSRPALRRSFLVARLAALEQQ